jgi:hypothetical protein
MQIHIHNAIQCGYLTYHSIELQVVHVVRCQLDQLPLLLELTRLGYRQSPHPPKGRRQEMDSSNPHLLLSRQRMM